MPWRKKDYVPKSPYWATAAGALLAVLFGVLIGYTRWGATASVVEIVERQLTRTEARIEVLEKRLGTIESKIATSIADDASAMKQSLESSPPLGPRVNAKALPPLRRSKSLPKVYTASMILMMFLALFFAAPQANAQDAKKIKIGYPAISYNQIHIWIAKDAGLFRRHGLDAEVIFFRGGQLATQAW